MFPPIVLLLLCLASPLLAQERRIAVTFDDLPAVTVRDTAEVAFLTTTILQSLEAHGVSAIGFVNAGTLGEDSTLRASRIAVLRRWLAADHELGNHSANHLSANTAPLNEVLADIAAGDSVPRALSAEFGRPYRWFREPYLHSGLTDAVRDSIDAVLAALDLHVAPVTIDPQDWLFAAAWRRSLSAGDTAAMARVEASFLDYADTMLAYHERLARKVTGSAIAHVLLLHANPMTAVVLDRLLTRIHASRYAIVPLAQAMQDPVYARVDRYRGAVGLAWLQRLAIYKRGVRIDDVPEPPAWIASLARATGTAVPPN